MNSGTLTGGIVKTAENVYTPHGLRRVVFPITALDSSGCRTIWHCEAEGTMGHHLGQTDEEWLDWLLTHAQPGAGIRLEYELASRAFMKRGVHVGEIRFLRVLRAEFPTRPAKKTETAVEPAANLSSS
jgi:hypothetical protein